MKKHNNLENTIDALLPQTQCGLCEYPDCRAYSQAIANNNEHIDKCLPGGIKTLKALGELLNQDYQPYVAGMQEKHKPAMLAVIREDECIGCTKCIQACPVDAIIGISKQMHAVINKDCTGCELCIAPCPVDCIDMIKVDDSNEDAIALMADQSRTRYQWHQERLARDTQEQRDKHVKAKLSQATQPTLSARKNAIAEAVARAKAKKE